MLRWPQLMVALDIIMSRANRGARGARRRENLFAPEAHVPRHIIIFPFESMILYRFVPPTFFFLGNWIFFFSKVRREVLITRLLKVLRVINSVFVAPRDPLEVRPTDYLCYEKIRSLPIYVSGSAVGGAQWLHANTCSVARSLVFFFTLHWRFFSSDLGQVFCLLGKTMIYLRYPATLEFIFPFGDFSQSSQSGSWKIWCDHLGL